MNMNDFHSASSSHSQSIRSGLLVLDAYTLRDHIFTHLEVKDLSCLAIVSKDYNTLMNTVHPLFNYTSIMRKRMKPSDWRWKLRRIEAILSNDWILAQELFVFILTTPLNLVLLFIFGVFFIPLHFVANKFKIFNTENYGYKSLICASFGKKHLFSILYDINRSKKAIYKNKSRAITNKLFLLNLIWLLTFGWIYFVLNIFVGVMHCVSIVRIFDLPKISRAAYYFLWPMEYDHFELSFDKPRVPLPDPFADFM
eukprot:TRINITY_DN2173_c0_g1_i4.p1 TRINITY_DN2173_c0_g1~~TRINITY_DN2173_c0_g1_i4.p1  ORF type:complete len:254 (+),score=36.71 TRINITY_DN2173_c0_g1_i4:352-1113(+)